MGIRVGSARTAGEGGVVIENLGLAVTTDGYGGSRSGDESVVVVVVVDVDVDAVVVGVVVSVVGSAGWEGGNDGAVGAVGGIACVGGADISSSAEWSTKSSLEIFKSGCSLKMDMLNLFPFFDFSVRFITKSNNSGFTL